MTLKFEIGARIRFVRLGGEVRGHFSKKHPGAQIKKGQNCLEIDERVGWNCWSWITFFKKDFPFGFQ